MTQIKVLYCKLLYRNKKIKPWQDGFLQYDANNKWTLLSETLAKLDSGFGKVHTQSEFETDHYVVSIVEETVLPTSAKNYVKRTRQPLKLNISKRPNYSEQSNNENSLEDYQGQEMRAEKRRSFPTKLTAQPCDSSINNSYSQKNDHANKNYRALNLERKRSQEVIQNPKYAKKSCLSLWNPDSDSEASDSQPSQEQQSVSHDPDSDSILHEETPSLKLQSLNLPPKMCSNQLYFPSEEQSRLCSTYRNANIPSVFTHLKHYISSFTEAVHECIQIQISTFAVQYRQKLKMTSSKNIKTVETFMRSNGIGFYGNAMMKKSSEAGACRLSISNKEHHSVYSKDDIWAISESIDFKRVILAKSVYYGPSSNLEVELACLSQKDSEIAHELTHEDDANVFAIRILNASSEFTAVSNLESEMQHLPILNSILGSSSERDHLKTLVSEENKCAFLALAEKTCLEFTLNSDQKR
jgi:hypothetical protein